MFYPVALAALLFLFTAPFGLGAIDTQFAGTIEVLAVFNSPAANSNIFPRSINEAGEIVGTIVPINSLTKSRGFFRLAGGQFSQIIEPNAPNYTGTYGLNNLRVVCGDYFDASNVVHGYFLRGPTFTQFDVPGANGTGVSGINDAGDFCGYYGDPNKLEPVAFVSIGGTIITIDLPDATTAFATDINNAGEIVGQYADSSGIGHGFFRDAAGNIIAPIDVAGGTTSTRPYGINDSGVIVGSIYGPDQHGFVLKLPNTVITYDYPSATTTAFRGINNRNLITGYYVDNVNFIAHAIVARLR